MAEFEAVVFGAGVRGTIYADYALDHPEELNIVAVAEPDAERREQFARNHSLRADRCFSSWEELLTAGTNGQVLINTTMDRMHHASTIAAIKAGYDVLLEKPMAPLLPENVELVTVAEQHGRLLQICHVLRYTPFAQAVRRVIDGGTLGRITSLDHRENLAYWHMAHSFVRGNWRNSEIASPMILTKCCHDFDLLGWLLRRRVRRLNSFGSLTHFTSENAPDPQVPLRCSDGCPVASECKYDATRFYGQDTEGWPFDLVTPVADREARLEALKVSPYGRCVYRCDNNVVDHQTVNMEYEDGTTATLVMNGQGYEESRNLRIDGTRATLIARFGEKQEITVYHHSGPEEKIPVQASDESGHGAGDTGLMRGFLDALRKGPGESTTTARESLESHLLAFAAEQSRLQYNVIDMEEFRRRNQAHE